MSKVGLLLFGRFLTEGNIDVEIEQSINSFSLVKSELDIHFAGFGVYAKTITKLNDNFLLDENLDIVNFQKTMVSKLARFSELGYNKTIISSCSYQIKHGNFLDKNLLIVSYDHKDLNESKTINHRFMYGRTSLLKRIWENKQFDITKDLDKNLFLNIFNVIGVSKMNENKIEMMNLIDRIGWMSE